MTLPILITGASGKTGRTLISHLQAASQPVRAFLRREQALDGVQGVIGSLESQSDLENALRGCRAVYHICPNVHPQELAIGKTLIAAAKAVGLKRIVYHSVLLPQASQMPHHWQKLLVEEQLVESGLEYSILQPTAYYQNLLAYLPAMRENGQLHLPYRPESAISLVDLRDVAEVAARVLLEDSHHAAIYPLAGTDPLSQHRVAELAGQALGVNVRATQMSWDEWEKNNQHLPDYPRLSLLAMFRFYHQHGLPGNPTVLGALLGRSPRKLEHFFAENAVY